MLFHFLSVLVVNVQIRRVLFYELNQPVLLTWYQLFQISALFRHPLKTWGNLFFFDIFKTNRNRKVALNKLLCYALRSWVPFIHFKKCGKYSWKSVFDHFVEFALTGLIFLVSTEFYGKDQRKPKGTLRQIWKSPYMFVFISKQYPGNSTFLILRILQLFTLEVCIFLKKWLIF